MGPVNLTIEAEAEHLVSLMMMHAAELCSKARCENEARRLVATPVNAKARFACVFRSIRTCEMSLQASWAVISVTSLTGDSPAGRAVEVLSLIKSALIAWLVRGDLGWVRQITLHVRQFVSSDATVGKITSQADADTGRQREVVGDGSEGPGSQGG